MEENPWGNWSYDLEMEEHLCHTNNTFDEEFLRDILYQIPQDQFNVPIATTDLVNNSSINVSQHAEEMPTNSLSIPTTEQHHDSLPLSSSTANQGSNSKKPRNTSDTLDHIMSERNRRQLLTSKIIELSALIPGLKKIDKVHVVTEAINYMKQLEERLKELEEDIKKKDAGSLSTITRSRVLIDKDIAIGEMNTEECYGRNESLLEVEARILEKEVLIKIYCGMQEGIVVNIMSQLQLLHLSITSINVLPFGNTLDITIIAKMGDKYNLTIKDLVKKLRVVATLQVSHNVQFHI
ncbi:transcription factor bHLH25 isoform X2 [Medicago truncatula]|uniref:Triterpene saponin activating regulator 3 n=2 Tax=Medicago truncatula TaxID=3880 RepID=A0A6M3RAT3_MEDTR|nr:transcription factor bHLH25 isoform X2 [Medicago truncatula]QJD08084.1 triterpene saponin activating regulator 3 [Medicago truncatula]